MADANWAQNPYNRRESYEKHALPNLLFRQCHMNCVDYENFLASDPAEQICVKNCQDKTKQAFELMLAVKMRIEAGKKTNAVDLSRFTGMEVEHAHDTASVLPGKKGVHTYWQDTEERMKYERSQRKDLIAAANDHTITSKLEKATRK